MDYVSLARPAVRQLHSYSAGTTIDQAKRRFDLDHVIKLSSNENPLGSSPKALAAMATLTDANLYADDDHLALSARLSEPYGLRIENTILGHGSNEILLMFFLTFVGPGDEVVMADPTFSLFPADTIVTGMVITMDGPRNIYNDGAVVVTGDTIVAVGLRTELEARYETRQIINAKNKLVLPGFINGHTHVPMTLFRGLHDDVTLTDWLYKYIFPAEKKNVTETFVRWGTRLAAAEQIRSGVTTFADMYYFEDAVAEETKAAGMRGVLGETFIDFPAPDNKNEAAMLEYTEKFLQKWQGDPLIHAAAAPHSPFMC